jgi:hypothetical protein
MMEHPLISSLDDVSVEDLGKKISELSKKLAIAQRTGNGYLCDQLRMALNTYQNKHTQRLQEMYKKETEDKNFDDKIDIS